MPQYIVKQPNGMYAIFSTVVDNFIAYDCAIPEVITHFEDYAKAEARRQAEQGIRIADSDPDRLKRSISAIESVHGKQEADVILQLMKGQCRHDRTNEDGICSACGKDCRGIG